MVNFRFLSSNTLKAVGLICASMCAWYLGYLFAEILPEDSVQTAIGSLQSIGMKPVIKLPAPKRQKCDLWTACPGNSLAYRLRSGGAKDNMPEICLDDEMIIGGAKNNADRGLNIAVINHDTWKVLEVKAFDMYEGGFSGPMIEFLNKIPKGAVVMITSHDDPYTKLTEEAKKALEELGSKEVRNLKFRSAWVFLAIKGSKLPDNLEKEKVNHSQQAKNRYSGWPAEIQIDGCLPKD
ncbi:protein FAM3B isoform 2-T2 [Discoglossus pictus]